MKDYIKERMGFALALLGVLLALHPFLSENKEASFVIFNVAIKFQHFYTLFAVLLGVSIYSYALHFIKHKGMSYTESAGNIFFLSALISPILYGILYFFYIALTISDKFVITESYRNLIALCGVSVSVVAYIYGLINGKKLLKQLQVGENSDAIDKIVFREIEKAKTLFETGLYEPAVVCIFNSIMNKFRNMLLKKGVIDSEVPDFQTIQFVKKEKLISKELMDRIHQLRIVRNQIVHPTESNKIHISKEGAASYMQLAGELLRFSSEEPFTAGSPCQMSGQKCPACKEGVMNVSKSEEGVECNKCGLFIGTPPA